MSAGRLNAVTGVFQCRQREATPGTKFSTAVYRAVVHVPVSWYGVPVYMYTVLLVFLIDFTKKIFLIDTRLAT
eukprot:SAG31_NODE_123_length_23712_cov_41.426291_6_plen_73_part_00